MAQPALPRQLAAAAAIGYGWGALMLLLSAGSAIPALLGGAGGAAAMSTPVVLSIASLIAAHGVRRRRRPFVALGASAAWIAFLVLVPLKLSLLGAALNVVILGLVLTNLRRFD